MKLPQTLAILFVAALGMHTAQAQQMAGLTRTQVVRSDLSQPGIEVIQVRVDFPAGADAPKHAHPGEEIAYALEGVMEYTLEGRPPVVLKAGESLFIPAGTNHSVRNIGEGKASELATYLVKKGKDLVVIAK